MDKKYIGALYWADERSAGFFLYGEHEREQFEKDKGNLTENSHYQIELNHSSNRAFTRLQTWTYAQDFEPAIEREKILERILLKRDEELLPFLEVFRNLPE